MAHGFVIEEASVMFWSSYYGQLKCKIVEENSRQTISSTLMSKSVQSYLPIQRGIQSFLVEFWDGSLLVSEFDFSQDDLLDRTFPHVSKQDHIQIIKETDCCRLHFTFYNQKNIATSFYYEDLILGIANKQYRLLEAKAIKKVSSFEISKLSNRRFSAIKTLKSKRSSKMSEDQAFRACRKYSTGLNPNMPPLNLSKFQEKKEDLNKMTITSILTNVKEKDKFLSRKRSKKKRMDELLSPEALTLTTLFPNCFRNNIVNREAFIQTKTSCKFKTKKTDSSTKAKNSYRYYQMMTEGGQSSKQMGIRVNTVM